MNSLVITVGLMFVGSALGAFLTQGARTSLAILTLVIGLSCCVAGVFWSRTQRLFGQAFTQSLSSAAADARIWLALAVLVWVFLSTMLFVRRAADTAATTTVLQAQITSLKNDLEFLRRDFQRFKTPRSLTQKQFDDMVDFLSTRDSQTITITYVRGDRETRQYAINFRNALTKAGWTITMAEVDDASYDVYIENDNARTPSGYTKAGVLLRGAFKEANVQGVGDSIVGDGGPASTRLVVGPKRD